VPRHAVAAGLRANELLDPGTRELVTYLAKRCPSPSVAKALKQGWWAAEGYIWAYYDTALFTKKAVPEAEGYTGSMENHCHVGNCDDKETAERDGPLLARGIWCGCQSCINYNFSDCLMKSEFGRYKHVYCKLAKNQHVSETRSMALEEFAQTLDKDQTRVVHASKTEWYIEGPYWARQGMRAESNLTALLWVVVGGPNHLNAVVCGCIRFSTRHIRPRRTR
jgi:hypothetical protein